MPSVRLTERAIRAASTEKVQEDWYDPSQPGFLLRLGRGGAKVFYFRYRTDEGRYRRVRLGDYPALSLAEAREKARAFKVSVDGGEDPAAARAEAREVPTVEELARAYVERYAKRHKRSWAADDRMLRLHVLPRLGRRKAAEVHRRDVLELLEHLVATDRPVLANRVLRVLSKMFNWGIEVDLVAVSPCYRVRPLSAEVSRTRVLTVEEIRVLWWALDQELPTTAASFRLLLLLGQRSAETSQMTWADLDGGVWTIPPEIAKGKRPHLVPLPGEAQREVAKFRGQHAKWVLPSPRRDGPFSEKALGHAARRLVARFEMDPWTPHDLRRTVAAQLEELGYDDPMIGRVLGRFQRSVTANYDRYAYLPEKHEALERWERRLLEIVAARP